MAGQMNPKQRYLSTLKGQEPDRPPVLVGGLSGFVQHYCGYSARELVENPEAYASGFVQVVDEFELSSVMGIGTYILFGCGPEVGVRWEFPGDELPAAIDGPIRSREDLDLFQIPSEPQGYFRNCLEIYRLVKKEVGDRVFLTSVFLSPFSIASFLRGIEQALMDLSGGTDFYEPLMEKCMEFSRFLGRHVLAQELSSTLMMDVLVTPEMINPNSYHEWIAPYNVQVIQSFTAKGYQVSDYGAAFMGQKGDRASQKAGRTAYQISTGRPECWETVKLGIDNARPGMPAMITLSARMLNGWPKSEILDLIKQALDYAIGEKGQLACISCASIDPMGKQGVQEMAEKLRSINQLVADYKP